MKSSESFYEDMVELIDASFLNFKDQVKLFEYLGNKLKVKTNQAYNRVNNKSHMGHYFAKGAKIRFPDVTLITKKPPEATQEV